MPSRTFGWIQDAGRLDQLRKAVEIFDIGFGEKLNVVKSRKPVGKVLNIGRWADENYTRFAQALGFIDYDREGDDFSITQLGIDLLKTKPGSLEEKEIFEKGLLSYPPVSRILELLINYGHLTKFEIGKKLGFQGEQGFPSYPQELFTKEYYLAKTPREKNKIISNKESTVDKYARMICHYLMQVGWVECIPKDLEYKEGNIIYKARTPHAFKITDKGRIAYRKVVGISTQRKIAKRITYEMLASGKQIGCKLLRHRRTVILEFLVRKGKLVPIEDIINHLKEKKIEVELQDVQNDIQGLINSGISIKKISDQHKITDRIELDIPGEETFELRNKELVEKLINKFLKTIQYVPQDIVQQIITQSFIGKMSLKFEQTVFDLYNKIIGFQGEKLGGAHKPDCLLWYKATLGNNSYGLIVDAKSREGYFSVGIGEVDKMRRYLEEFTPVLKEKYQVSKAHFLWVSSGFRGTYKHSLERLHSKSKSYGALISSQNSLILAENITNQNRSDILMRIEPLFMCLDEIKQEKIISVIGD